MVATKLKEWLPLVLQGSQPWLSTEDIRKGARWQGEVTDALSEPGAGILCLTQDNLDAPWLLFEAGAIFNASTLARSYVCTYLIGLQNAAVPLPLGMFQSTIATRDDTYRLLRALNDRLREPLPNERLSKLFDTFWCELEAVIIQTAESPQSVSEKRPDRELLEEILTIVRGAARTTLSVSDVLRDPSVLFRGSDTETEESSDR